MKRLAQTLVRDPYALAFDLRASWALGRRVVLVLDERAAFPRVAGQITAVAATGAFVRVQENEEDEGIHVPLERILSATHAHFHQGTWRPRTSSGAVPIQIPGQLALVPTPEVSEKARPVLERAAGNLLGEDLLQTLAAIDHCAIRVPVTEVIAMYLGRSGRWTVARLRILERQGYVERFRDRSGHRWRLMPR